MSTDVLEFAAKAAERLSHRTASLERQVEARTLEAIRRLAKLMSDENVPPAARLKAAKAILRCAYGNPLTAREMAEREPKVRIVFLDNPNWPPKVRSDLFEGLEAPACGGPGRESEPPA